MSKKEKFALYLTPEKKVNCPKLYGHHKKRLRM